MSIYRDMNNHDQSLVIAQKAVERFPQSAAVLWNAANAYQLMHDMVKADELRARARAIQPNIGKWMKWMVYRVYTRNLSDNKNTDWYVMERSQESDP